MFQNFVYIFNKATNSVPYRQAKQNIKKFYARTFFLLNFLYLLSFYFVQDSFELQSCF